MKKTSRRDAEDAKILIQKKILLRKTSLVDFPGCVSAVFFFSGCNLRCPWCHNRNLITGEGEAFIEIEAGLAHLTKRKNILGGVVLSGGEPCLWGELASLIVEIKKIPIPVKLDTNGMFPALLENLFSREESRPDFIALDLKAAPSRYRELLPSGETAPDPGELLCRSAALIRSSGIRSEYRSLALPGGFFTESDVEALAPLADNSPWYFRPFKGGNCLDPAWDSMEEPAGVALERAASLAAKARELGKNGIAR